MCRRVTCTECGKETWAGKKYIVTQNEWNVSHMCFYGILGCGQHIKEALAGLKEEEICHCKEEQAKQKKD
ncbi:hypothetical protein BCR42DRAFT_162408 [Absidia repens]|uniref:Uncharacterized protein n=1 Tax=Absidia repens TaxID=90262 RepID=A0A1X2ITH8_9FUNG|nr:hypothetical protein BCR42DRAFT_162408 [Absidia repens]